MKKFLTLIALGAALSLPAMAQTAQQNRMKTCNADAGDRKGEERKAFMKQCLSAAKLTQQEKMKACNTDASAKSLKGDERKAYMKGCLSGSGKSA